MKKYNKGFTLLEMVVVITVVSILSIVGKFSYDMSVEKSRYSEFSSTITAIQNAQLAYYVENQRYASSIFDLGLDIRGEEEHDLNRSFFSNGEGIRTKYFIYGTELSTKKYDRDNRRAIFIPYINAYRYEYSSEGEIKYLSGVSLYNIDYSTKKMEKRTARYSGSKGQIYTFKKILKTLVSNPDYV